MRFLRKKRPASATPKSFWQEWLHPIAFAVVVATLVRGLFMGAFAIPTGSMEGSLLVGDRIYVSKIHYGARLPQTPLQLPLIHQTIPGTEISSYLDGIQWPYVRLPGLGEVERGEVVVFNYPPEWDRPVDMKTFYVKRCVALPGDTLQIINKQLWVNGQRQPLPPEGQTSYRVRTRQTVHPRVWQQHEVSDIRPTTDGYHIFTQPTTAQALQKLPFIDEVQEITYPPSAASPALYPEELSLPWTPDFYGPVYLPRTGDRIVMNEFNTALYGPAIVHYEKVGATLVDRQLRMGGKNVTTYTFQQDYYFMMGDNRHNSADSRMWGFVPEDHIAGKPLFVWFSLDEQADWWDKVRWDRLLMPIE